MDVKLAAKKKQNIYYRKLEVRFIDLSTPLY